MAWPVSSNWIGSPRRVATDDFYQGYYIPKGSVIVGNVWYVDESAQTRMNNLRFNWMIGPYYTTRMYIPTHMHSVQSGSLTKTAVSMSTYLTQWTWGYSDLVDGSVYRCWLVLNLIPSVLRICPGRFFANNGTMIMVASVLSVFDIRLPVGPDIKREDQTNLSEHLTTSGIVSYIHIHIMT